MRNLDEVISRYNYILISLVVIVLFFIVKSFISKLTRGNECPNCHVSDAERVQKGFFSQILFFGWDVKKFKCLKCWNTYFVFNAESKNLK
jgi:DNA-directed RNA polymerase subunit RPC12/RpoP